MAKQFIELEPQYRGKPFVVNGIRYVRCRNCAELKTASEFVTYGGAGLNINIGLCRVCGYKNESNSSRKEGKHRKGWENI